MIHIQLKLFSAYNCVHLVGGGWTCQVEWGCQLGQRINLSIGGVTGLMIPNTLRLVCLQAIVLVANRRYNYNYNNSRPIRIQSAKKWNGTLLFSEQYDWQTVQKPKPYNLDFGNAPSGTPYNCKGSPHCESKKHSPNIIPGFPHLFSRVCSCLGAHIHVLGCPSISRVPKHIYYFIKSVEQKENHHHPLQHLLRDK